MKFQFMKGSWKNPVIIYA